MPIDYDTMSILEFFRLWMNTNSTLNIHPNGAIDVTGGEDPSLAMPFAEAYIALQLLTGFLLMLLFCCTGFCFGLFSFRFLLPAGEGLSKNHFYIINSSATEGQLFPSQLTGRGQEQLVSSSPPPPYTTAQELAPVCISMEEDSSTDSSLTNSSSDDEPIYENIAILPCMETLV